MINHDVFTILQLLLEMAVGVIAIIAFHAKISGGLTARDLLKKVEEKDREIERLRLQKGSHNYRTIHAKSKHLHLAKKRYTL
jgi:hypothetical protein